MTAARTALATSLTCDNLAGWPTTTPVHFSTYRLNSSNAVVAGSQIDWKGIVAGNTIGSLTRKAGATDSGNAIGDVVEMNPTGSWAQDLIDGITTQHNQDGTHGTVTASGLITANGGLTVPTGKALTVSSGGTVSLPSGSLSAAALTTPYKFSVYRNAALTISSVANTPTNISPDTVVFDTGSNFSSGKFTAPVAGFYHFDASISVANVGSQDSYIMLYKNGTEHKRGTQKTPGIANTTESYQVSAIVQAAIGDTFEIYVTMVVGSRSINVGQNLSYFMGNLMSTL